MESGGRSVVQAEIDFVLTCHGATSILNRY